MYTSLGKMHETGRAGFMQAAKVQKQIKKAVDIPGEIRYISITKKNEHELVNDEHEPLESEHELETSSRMICKTRPDML